LPFVAQLETASFTRYASFVVESDFGAYLCCCARVHEHAAALQKAAAHGYFAGTLIANNTHLAFKLQELPLCHQLFTGIGLQKMTALIICTDASV